MVDKTKELKKLEQESAAKSLKRQQDKFKEKFEYLANTPAKYFQAEYVKAQAEEICNYVKAVAVSPLNPWYSALVKLTSEGSFMSTFYLTFNEYGVIEPDYERINTLVLPDPDPDEFPRSIILS